MVGYASEVTAIGASKCEIIPSYVGLRVFVVPGIVLGICPANERRRYKSSLIEPITRMIPVAPFTSMD